MSFIAQAVVGPPSLLAAAGRVRRRVARLADLDARSLSARQQLVAAAVDAYLEGAEATAGNLLMQTARMAEVARYEIHLGSADRVPPRLSTPRVPPRPTKRPGGDRGGGHRVE